MLHSEEEKKEDGNISRIKDLETLFDYIRMLESEGYPKAFLETEHFIFEFSRASLKRGRIIADVVIRPKNEGERRKMSKILIVAAHPDDEILGCGATVAKMISKGWEAKSVILGQGMLSRNIENPDNALKRLTATRPLPYSLNPTLYSFLFRLRQIGQMVSCLKVLFQMFLLMLVNL